MFTLIIEYMDKTEDTIRHVVEFGFNSTTQEFYWVRDSLSSTIKLEDIKIISIFKE